MGASRPLPYDPFRQWGIKKVVGPEVDIEAPGQSSSAPQSLPYSTGSFARLERQIAQQGLEISALREENRTLKQMIKEGFRTIYENMQIPIPSCFRSSPTRDEGGPSSRAPVSSAQERPVPPTPTAGTSSEESSSEEEESTEDETVGQLQHRSTINRPAAPPSKSQVSAPTQSQPKDKAAAVPSTSSGSEFEDDDDNEDGSGSADDKQN